MGSLNIFCVNLPPFHTQTIIKSLPIHVCLESYWNRVCHSEIIEDTLQCFDPANIKDSLTPYMLFAHSHSIMCNTGSTADFIRTLSPSHPLSRIPSLWFVPRAQSSAPFCRVCNSSVFRLLIIARWLWIDGFQIIDGRILVHGTTCRFIWIFLTTFNRYRRLFASDMIKAIRMELCMRGTAQGRWGIVNDTIYTHTHTHTLHTVWMVECVRDAFRFSRTISMKLPIYMSFENCLTFSMHGVCVTLNVANIQNGSLNG